MNKTDGPELLRRVLGGDTTATRALVDLLSPVVHARVAGKLLRRGRALHQNRDLRQEIEDFVQEVFTALFENGGRRLRAWNPSRGLTLPNFVGLLAERQVEFILRSGRRSPLTEEATNEASMERLAGSTENAHAVVSSRQLLTTIVERLRAGLTPIGAQMFQLLVVEGQSVQQVCERTGMSADAVYAWRSRLAKQAAKIRDELET